MVFNLLPSLSYLISKLNLGSSFVSSSMNDISKSVNANLRLVADDCVLQKEIQSSQDCLFLQDDLDQLSLWSKTWQLNFYVKKCYHLGKTCKKFPILF